MHCLIVDIQFELILLFRYHAPDTVRVMEQRRYFPNPELSLLGEIEDEALSLERELAVSTNIWPNQRYSSHVVLNYYRGENWCCTTKSSWLPRIQLGKLPHCLIELALHSTWCKTYQCCFQERLVHGCRSNHRYPQVTLREPWENVHHHIVFTSHIILTLARSAHTFDLVQHHFL